MERITLEQFHIIKKQLFDLVKQSEEIYKLHINDNNFDFMDEIKVLEKQYGEIQDKLLSYDLSGIAFTEWKGLELIADKDYIVDLSKTKANIDFSILNFSDYINYKGCRIKNITKVERIINSEYFDSTVIEKNPSLFISDLFDEEIKEKIYTRNLKIEDLIVLTDEQIKELGSKLFINNFEVQTRYLIYRIGLQKAIQLCLLSREDYKVVYDLINYISGGIQIDYVNDYVLKKELEEELKTASVFEIKKLVYDYVRYSLLNKNQNKIHIDKLPELFVKENTDILLTDSSIPEDLRNRYYNKQLTVDDILDNISIFKGIPLDNFCEDYDIRRLSECFKDCGLQQAIEKYQKQFRYIIKSNLTDEFVRFVDNINEYIDSENLNIDIDFTNDKHLKNALEAFFKFNGSFESTLELINYEDDLFPLSERDKIVIDNLGLENIKKFENETKFFSINGNNNIEMFNALSEFFYTRNRTGSKKNDETIDFKKGTLAYEEFKDQLAKCLDYMRGHNYFTDFISYDWMEGEFRDKHPELFIDNQAPEELRKAFYRNNIFPKLLFQHAEYIPYLVDKNMVNTVNAHISLAIPCFMSESVIIPEFVDFIEEYTSRYGNEKLLKLIAKYGDVVYNIGIVSLHDEIDDEEAISEAMKKAIYLKIKEGYLNYSYLKDVKEIANTYPQLFVDFDLLVDVSNEEKLELEEKFYNRNLVFGDIRKFPELVHLLKNKELKVAFKDSNPKSISITKIFNFHSDFELLDALGNEEFLKVCSIYGDYLYGMGQEVGNEVDINSLDNEQIIDKIKEVFIRKVTLGELNYFDTDAPLFLKEEHPELFLDEAAPEELKRYFYSYHNFDRMTFGMIHKHKMWIPFLKDKSVKTALLRGSLYYDDLVSFFNLFGDEKGIKLGINRAETVEKMINSHQVDLMKSWYDKTGGKFIPDIVVMQNFDLNEADKFLRSGSNWSTLMRIKNYSHSYEAKDAMLKLAYSFGAFDQDQKGFKKLLELLTGLPRNISEEYSVIIESISSLSEEDAMSQGWSEYIQLKDTLVQEGFELNYETEIMEQIYRKNEDGSRTLTINPQSFPKSSQLIRSLLEMYPIGPYLTAYKAHQLFGGFELKYDPYFRDFLLANLETILTDPNYTSYLSNIQRQFDDIRAANSNRNLTLDLAVSYIQTNKYYSVNTGNERVAEISAIAGYSQADFLVLQEIYNYGKQRVFSSIPRIERTKGKYKYEMLRLDDPLAMAIGTLTDCCQQLNDCAEACMEHSMVDQNGRVFIIRDDENNIVAQSWVWRNKDVLCFDNIEIPNKAFARANRNGLSDREIFTDEIYDIYKEAAHYLIEEDEEIYRKLLEENEITQEQYDGLRLGKVTVGLGYNDIANSLKNNSKRDKINISRPLPFIEPVTLSKGLYTNDSTTQYILEERDDRCEFDGLTLPVHSDKYIIYDDSNFTDNRLLSLKKLEMVTKNNPIYLDTEINSYVDRNSLVTELAYNYGLNPDTTRVIMNANFAIIYDSSEREIRIGDLLYNTHVDNGNQQLDIEDKVVMQIKLALEQISDNKTIDISRLSEEQREIYDKAISQLDNINRDGGVNHAK